MNIASIHDSIYLATALAGLITLLIVSGSSIAAFLFVVRRRRYGRYFGQSYAPAYGQSSPIRDEILEMIYKAQNDTGIWLTPAGQEMLIIPVVEQFEVNSKAFSFGEAAESIRLILRAIAESGTPYMESKSPSSLHTAQSVIRAFWMRFCKIPPFCDGRG